MFLCAMVCASGCGVALWWCTWAAVTVGVWWWWARSSVDLWVWVGCGVVERCGAVTWEWCVVGVRWVWRARGGVAVRWARS